jgi:hypothetical protein
MPSCAGGGACPTVVRAAAFGLLLSAAAALPLRAQPTATTGEIEGSLVDPSGAVIAGARLAVRNVDTGFDRSTRSDGRGSYRLSLLPRGRYELMAEAAGFASLKREDLALDVGQSLTLHLVLKLATRDEVVDVRGEPEAVETTRSLSATRIDERSIASLPSNGRRFEDFVLLTPRTVAVGPGALVSSAGLVSIGGQRGVNTAYAVDGADYGEPQFAGIRGGDRSGVIYTLSQEALQEIHIENAGYSAEFGDSGGGVVNAITKTGTNRLQGSAFWFFQDEALTARDPFGNSLSDFSQHQFGATLGGPIRKDTAHFFLAYDQQIRRSPFVVRFDSDPAGIPRFDGKEGTFTQTNDIETALARVDLRLSDRHQLSVRYSWSHNHAENATSSNPTNTTVDGSSLELDTTHTLLAELNSALAPGRLNVLRFQWSHEARASEPNSAEPMIIVGGLGTTGRFFFIPARPSDDRYQLSDAFTLLRGRHSLRFGTVLNLMPEGTSYFLPFGSGAYFFGSVSDYLQTVDTGEQAWGAFFQGFGRVDGRFKQEELALFAEDTWKPRANLTLNLGLRYDAHFQPQPDTPNPDLPQSAFIPSDKRQLGPRLGVAWDPGNDGRSVLRLNLGLFYARTPGAHLYTAFVENGFARTILFFPPGFPGAPVFPDTLEARPDSALAPPPFAYVVDPGYRNPRTLQVSAGFEREIRRSLTVCADFVHARARFLSRLLDTNILPAEGRAADGRLAYPSERPNSAFAQIDQLQSSARGAYDALTLGAQKRWGGSEAGRGLRLEAFYTYARNKDDDSTERKASLALQYQDWQDLPAEYTWSDNDVRHNFVLNGTADLHWGIQLGVILVARSGTPYSHTDGTSDLNNDGEIGNDRQFIDGRDTGRNSYRQPGYNRLDVRLAKTMKLGGRRALDLAVDVFNAWNAKNLVVPAQNQTFEGPEPGTLNPRLDQLDGQAGHPRAGQLSVRFRF